MASRGNLIFVAGITAVVALVVLGYVFILGPTAPPAATVAVEPSVPEAPKAQLVRADGSVEIRSGTGEWRAAAVGSEVGPEAEVRTGAGAAARIGYGDALSVDVMGDAEVRVDKLDADNANLVVREGLVVADVRPESGRVVRIGAVNSDAVTEVRDGRVNVLSDGQGTVQTAVLRGKADVTAKGVTVEVKENFATTVEAGKAPSAPKPLPKSLLLKIKWPPKAPTAKRKHLVTGTTNPGARVRVGRTVVTADAKGRFRAILELTEGENRVKAYALDVGGRIQQAESPPIELDTKAPTHGIKTDPGMWIRKKK